MNKFLPYIFSSLLLGAIIMLIVTSRNKNVKRFDDRITFRKQDKIPYGTYAAFTSLQYIFPQAAITINKNEPGYWDSISNDDSGQALIIIAPYFHADKYEMNKLMMFVESGNDLFISARNISVETENILKCKTSIFGISEFFRGGGIADEDSLALSLYSPPYFHQSRYTYPGFNFNAWAFELDTVITEKLGGDDLSKPNFLQFKAGRGSLYLHLAPMAFSNYFLLHRNNNEYFEKIFSVISPDIKKIAWDEYFLEKGSEKGDVRADRPGWFSVLMRFPALKAALITAILTLLVFVLVEMRRNQRMIPLLAKPRNDSMDFIKTIGRLYHDKGDHKNLCRKMASYFLEYIRSKYNMITNRLDEEFIENLHLKSEHPQPEIIRIVIFIRNLEDAYTINDDQLISFHKQLESFYQNT